jgi:hypothetical protein
MVSVLHLCLEIRHVNRRFIPFLILPTMAMETMLVLASGKMLAIFHVLVAHQAGLPSGVGQR